MILLAFIEFPREGVSVNASDLREVFETVLPEAALRAAVEAAGLQERERKLSAQRLLRAVAISAATGHGGRQADVTRLYFEQSFGTFCPLEPTLVTADEVPDPQAFRLRYELNGAVMQNGHTGGIIFTVADLIARPSCDTTLLAGTLIPTSTRGGVGFTRQPPVFLAAGDRVNIEIEGIVRLTNPVEAE